MKKKWIVVLNLEQLLNRALAGYKSPKNKIYFHRIGPKNSLSSFVEYDKSKQLSWSFFMQKFYWHLTIAKAFKAFTL